MITAAALVSHPPLLLRELGGAHDPVADLRAAAVDVVGAATRDAERVVVVGPADLARTWDRSDPVDVRGFGTTGPRLSGDRLPLSPGVGVRLLAESGWTGPVEVVTMTWNADSEDVDALAGRLTARPGRTAVLLLGDGSARRGDTAPGFLDDRAFPFDDAVAKAVADGDAAALAGLDAPTAAELMVLGSATFRLLGALALRDGRVPRAALAYRDDPFGVTYLAATWHFPLDGGLNGALNGAR